MISDFFSFQCAFRFVLAENVNVDLVFVSVSNEEKKMADGFL